MTPAEKPSKLEVAYQWLAFILLASLVVMLFVAISMVAVQATSGHSAEVAAWGQAIGSILAIVAAFMVGNHQTSVSLRIEQERRDLQELKIYAALDIYLMNMRGCLSNIEEQSFFQLEDEHNEHVLRLQEIQQMYYKLPMVDIPDQWTMTMVIAISNDIPKLLTRISAIRRRDGTFRFEDVAEHVRLIRADCEAIHRHVYLALESCDSHAHSLEKKVKRAH